MKYKSKIILPLIYMCVAGFWGLIYYRIPLIQDAWASNGIYNGEGNFINWVKSALLLYNTLNGRCIATIAVGFFERNEVVLDIACVFLLTLITFLYKKCLSADNVFAPLYALLALLMVPASVRTEVYFYATMIYIVPVVSILLFAICLDRYLRNRNKRFGRIRCYIVLLFIGFINACWIEHTSFAFVLVFAALILYDAKKNRKLDVRLVIAEGVFAVAFIVMMLSPGLRLQREFAIEGKSTILIIMDNLDIWFNILFLEQSGLLILLIGACVCFVLCNTQKFKSALARNIYVGTMLLWGAFTVRNFFLQDIPSISSIVKMLLIILFFVEVSLPIYLSDFRITFMIFYLTGLLSLAPVIATPNLSYRVCYYFFIMINFVTVGIWVESVTGILKLEVFAEFLLLVPLVIVIDSYCIVTYCIHDIQKVREELIEEAVRDQRTGEWDYNDVLVLPRFSPQQLYAGASPQKYDDRIHYQVFLEYYDLNPNTLVYFGDSYDRLKAIEDKKGGVTLTVQPALNNIAYSYQFRMLNAGMVIEESEVIEETDYQFIVPDAPGSYYFSCVLTDGYGNSIVVSSPKIIDRE